MGILMLLIGLYPLQGQHNTPSEIALTEEQKNIVKIASLTAQGNLEELDTALNEGLNNGLTVNEIKEVVVHLYAYCGFPRSIMGLRTLLKVLDDRKKEGITDEWGKEASPISDTRSKYDRGIESLQELTKTNMEGPKPDYQQFSPEMDVFLKEHLFADIFERDILTYAQRELTTISVIASLGGLEPMLRGHFNLSLNVGLTPEQLNTFIRIIETTAGKERAEAAKSVLDTVLKDRQ